MPVYTDQMHREIELSSTPHKIVSLVPSQTELLYDLGLREQVIGITKFCIHPEEWFKTKTRIGGTKKLNIELIKSLNPDLIIGNEEENEQPQIAELSKHFPVWLSDVQCLADALEMITAVGSMTKKETKALLINDDIQRAFSRFKIRLPEIKFGSVAYFIWKEPIMVAGGDTFIGDMLRRCNLENVFESRNRYPEVIPAKLIKAKPDYIFLSSEPYPFNEKHIAEFKSFCPKAQIMLVDGEMFSWYGSRLIKAPVYFKNLLEQIKA